MSGFVYRVTLTSRHPKSGEPYFVNFECGYADIDQLVDQLNDGRLVRGEALFSRKNKAEGVFEVVKRKPFAIALNGVAHIEPPDVRFVEYEEVEHVAH